MRRHHVWASFSSWSGETVKCEMKVISSPDIRRYSFIGPHRNFIIILNPPYFSRHFLGSWPKRPPTSRDVNSIRFLSGSSAWRQSQHWLTQSENNLGSNILTSSTVESDDKLNLRCHYSVSEQCLFYLEDFTANDQMEPLFFWQRIRLNCFHAMTAGRVLCSILIGASVSCETACNSGPSAFSPPVFLLFCLYFWPRPWRAYDWLQNYGLWPKQHSHFFLPPQ